MYHGKRKRDARDDDYDDAAQANKRPRSHGYEISRHVEELENRRLPAEMAQHVANQNMSTALHNSRWGGSTVDTMGKHHVSEVAEYVQSHLRELSAGRITVPIKFGVEQVLNEYSNRVPMTENAFGHLLRAIVNRKNESVEAWATLFKGLHRELAPRRDVVERTKLDRLRDVARAKIRSQVLSFMGELLMIGDRHPGVRSVYSKFEELKLIETFDDHHNMYVLAYSFAFYETGGNEVCLRGMAEHQTAHIRATKVLLTMASSYVVRDGELVAPVEVDGSLSMFNRLATALDHNLSAKTGPNLSGLRLVYAMGPTRDLYPPDRFGSCARIYPSVMLALNATKAAMEANLGVVDGDADDHEADKLIFLWKTVRGSLDPNLCLNMFHHEAFANVRRVLYALTQLALAHLPSDEYHESYALFLCFHVARLYDSVESLRDLARDVLVSACGWLAQWEVASAIAYFFALYAGYAETNFLSEKEHRANVLVQGSIMHRRTLDDLNDATIADPRQRAYKFAFGHRIPIDGDE